MPTADTVFELRRYRLHPGTRETLIALFEREFIETQEAAGMRVIGQFRDRDDPDSFVWLRGFADMAARTAAMAAFYGGPVWAAHRDAANATMVNSDNVLLLRAARAGSGFGAGMPRPGVDAAESAGGLYVATVCSLAPHTEEAFADLFESSARSLLAAAGARIEATLLTERSANGFPRLPVREGETVFVWLMSFADAAAYERHRAALAETPEWTERVLPEMDRRMWRRAEVARLVPTARSGLRQSVALSPATSSPP